MIDETKIIQRWRAKTGEPFAYITISPFGVFRVTKSVERGRQVEDELYASGNYFRIEECEKFKQLIKDIFKNRI